MIKNKESSYPKYLDGNNLCRWAMSQKLPVNKFEWIEENFQYNEHFIKNYNDMMKKLVKDIFLKSMFNTQEN